MIPDICQQCRISEIVEFQLKGLLLCKECYKDMLSDEDWVRLEQEEWKRENNIKIILDASCGSRMFWFDKKNPAVVFMDNREIDDVLCDGRKLIIKPDVLADFRNMPFANKSFKLVVFDPPHLIRAGENSWLSKKYGVLKNTWRQDIKQGFNECMRVLDDYGVLIFKWNEEQIKQQAILDVIGQKPLFGDRRGKTHWMVFMKFEGEKE